jgi:hypothetical protein
MKITTTLLALFLGANLTLFAQQSTISSHVFPEELKTFPSLSEQWNKILEKDAQLQSSITSSRAIGSTLSNELSVLTKEYFDLINSMIVNCKIEETIQLLEMEQIFVSTIAPTTSTK